MIASLQHPTPFDIGTILALIAALGTAFAQSRMLKPQRDRIVSSIKHDMAQEADALIGRYRELLEATDKQLTACHTRIDDLERREADCEHRADDLAERVAWLERQHQGGST